MWDTAAGKEIKTIDGAGYVPALAYVLRRQALNWLWIPDGKNRTAVHLRHHTWKASEPVVEADRLISCLAFSADGELVATGGAKDGNVRIWKTAKGDRLFAGELAAHQANMADLIFTPDKKYLLTGSASGEVRIWELDKARPGPSRCIHSKPMKEA